MSALFRTVLLALVAALSSLAQNGPLLASSVPSAALVAAPGSPYAAGSQPRVVATGDFNGDGLPDLAFFDQGADGTNWTLTILLATPDGAVVPASGGPISVGSYYSTVAVADFNRDGKLDIVAVGPYEIKILLGDGTGGFSLAPKSPIDTMSLGFFGPYALAVGDFNRDGTPDLVILTGASDAELGIFLGNGDGSFTFVPANTVAIGTAAQQLTVADFNGDGNLDVAIACLEANQLIVLLGDGRGGFVSDPKGPLPTGYLPLSIAHGDLNGDGNHRYCCGQRNFVDDIAGRRYRRLCRTT